MTIGCLSYGPSSSHYIPWNSEPSTVPTHPAKFSPVPPLSNADHEYYIFLTLTSGLRIPMRNLGTRLILSNTVVSMRTTVSR